MNNEEDLLDEELENVRKERDKSEALGTEIILFIQRQSPVEGITNSEFDGVYYVLMDEIKKMLITRKDVIIKNFIHFNSSLVMPVHKRGRVKASKVVTNVEKSVKDFVVKNLSPIFNRMLKMHN